MEHGGGYGGIVSPLRRSVHCGMLENAARGGFYTELYTVECLKMLHVVDSTLSYTVACKECCTWWILH